MHGPTMSRKETPSCWEEDDDPEIGLPVTYKSGTGVAYHQQRQKKLDKAKHGQSVRILACREPSTGRDGASHRPGIGREAKQVGGSQETQREGTAQLKGWGR